MKQLGTCNILRDTKELTSYKYGFWRFKSKNKSTSEEFEG